MRLILYTYVGTLSRVVPSRDWPASTYVPSSGMSLRAIPVLPVRMILYRNQPACNKTRHCGVRSICTITYVALEFSYNQDHFPNRCAQPACLTTHNHKIYKNHCSLIHPLATYTQCQCCLTRIAAKPGVPYEETITKIV